MKIGRKDIFWNYLATFMRLASGIIILPLVLKLLPTEEYGLWIIFVQISSLPALLDFGFSSSFSRNVAYVFSGVSELKSQGYEMTESTNKPVNYNLLKTVIRAMQRYYGAMALAFLIIFYVVSPFYLGHVLDTKYHGSNQQAIWIAWFTYGTLVAYEFYTYYYNSLMSGRGLIMRNMQIIVLSQILRITISVIFLLMGYGIISMVIGMLVGDIVNRTCSYLSFYDKTTKESLRSAQAQSVFKIMKIMAPNAVKIGLTSVGFFALSQATTLLSPIFLTLKDTAEYGLSKTIVSIMISIGGTWFGTFYPQLNRYRVIQDSEGVKRLYLKGIAIMFMVFVVTGSAFILLGNPILTYFKYKTHLLNSSALSLMVIFGFFEGIQSISTSTLLSKNEVPFFKSVLFSGMGSLLLLYFFFYFTNLGVLSLILAPGIALSVYHNWKWPVVVFKEINIKRSDFKHVIKNLLISFQRK